jgi:hypothetical protein
MNQFSTKIKPTGLMQVIVAHLKSSMLIGLLNRISISHHYALQNSRILLNIVPVRTESYHGLKICPSYIF